MDDHVDRKSAEMGTMNFLGVALQVFAIKIVTFAIDFVPFTMFVALAV